jgi:uncharacterized protein YegP (UPF0339 family)
VSGTALDHRDISVTSEMERKMANFVIKKNASRQYWWRLVSSNGRIIADSAETYQHKSDARAMIDWIKANASSTPVSDQTGEL